MDEKEYHTLYAAEENHWWFVSKRAFIKTDLGGLFPPRPSLKVLDLGCGTGGNLTVLSLFGQVTGIDASKLAVSYAKKRGVRSVVHASIDKIPFKKASFDVVAIIDVLYHKNIPSDTTVLHEAYRVLRPGGTLLVIDCAHQWLFGPHDVHNHARQRYSLAEMKQKIQDTGFSVLRSSYLFFLTFPIFMFERLSAKWLGIKGDTQEEIPPAWINKALIMLLAWEARVLHITNLPMGSSLLFLARKQ